MKLSTILTTGEPGDYVEVTRDEADALARSVGWALGRPEEQAMIGLLRKLAPQHPTLVTLDAIARDHGFVRAGSDERLPHWSDCASHRGGTCDMGPDCGATS